MKYGIVDILNGNKVDLLDILDAKIVFFGEVHKVDWIINLETELIELKSREYDLGFVGLELFNYRMDEIVNRWLSDKITWNELVEEYSKGKEGFPLENYKPVLKAAKNVGVKIIGVMPPREEANKIAKFGIEAIEQIEDLPATKEEVIETYQGYRETLMSMIPRQGPMAKLDPEKIIYAQALKDQVIANRVYQATKKWGEGIVITGFAHMEFRGSATTRVKKLGFSDIKSLTSRDMDYREALDDLNKRKNVLEAQYLAYRL